jgi:RHS repeat-associated protein
MVVESEYNAGSGMLQRLREPGTGGRVFWQLDQADSTGNLEQETFGNGAVSTRAYDPVRGFLDQIATTRAGSTIQSLNYKYRRDGRVKLRQDTVNSVSEAFLYDQLGRLDSWYSSDNQGSWDGGWRVNYAYDDRGNMTQRSALVPSAVGQVVQTHFNTFVGPHQLYSSTLWKRGDGSTDPFEYDGAGNVTKHPGLGTVTYTPFNLPRKVTAFSESKGYSADFWYDALGGRARKTASGKTTTYLGGLYEERVEGFATAHVFYVGGAAQVARTETLSGGGSWQQGAEEVTYMHGDHLGSVDVTSTQAGNASGRLFRDPFGNRVTKMPSGQLDTRISPTRPVEQPTSTSVTLGFTGHESEDDLGVINMRGRIYEPRAGRFLQADPFVPAPYASQGFNRYSYVFNDPLNAIDPSGFQPTYTGPLPAPRSPGETVTVETVAFWVEPYQGVRYQFNGPGAPGPITYKQDGFDVTRPYDPSIAGEPGESFRPVSRSIREIPRGPPTPDFLPPDYVGPRQPHQLKPPHDVNRPLTPEQQGEVSDWIFENTSLTILSPGPLRIPTLAEFRKRQATAHYNAANYGEYLKNRVLSGILGGDAAAMRGGLQAARGANPSLGAHKEALKKVHTELGGSLPPGKPGKFGSPQRGDSKKGYRLDPPHSRDSSSPESKPHINWWDYTTGKRGRGGKSGAVPIED